MFGVTSIVKNSDKEKWVCNDYGIAFDGRGTWNFGNEFARNIVIFNIDCSLSFHADNLKNRFLVLGEVPTCGINGSFGALENKVNINFSFSKAKTKFCPSLHINDKNAH